MRLVLFVFVLLPWFINCNCNSNTVIVSTSYGKLKGYSRDFDKSIGLGNISKVNIYLGVPYASPPTGDLRFRPPVKPIPWKGIHDATEFKAMCYQDQAYNRMFWLQNATWPSSDDCLYLNIYAPNTTLKTFYPVMVYIHGGGYEAGSPVVSPGDILPLWDVVLVTIQYRLGAFGFISTGDSAAPGNYGMLDQIEVLKWIKENIRVFKGDPSRVTIFGESAGGSSVGLLLLSPLSKGLFHSAIPLSGIDFSPFAINTQRQASMMTKVTAQKLNCPKHNSKKLMECMREVQASEIFRVTVNDSNVWRPVVDGIFLHDTPRNLRKSGKFHPYPMLVGFTQNEGAYFISSEYYASLNCTPFTKASIAAYNMVYYAFERPYPSFESSAHLEEALAFQYTPWPDSNNEVKLNKAIFDIISDYCFTAPAHDVLEMHSAVAPTYLFVFSHRSDLSESPWWKGVTHKDDNPYEFGFPLMGVNVLQQYDEKDRNVSQFMISLLTNFARTHNPTPEPLSGCTLSRFNATQHNYINISINPTIESSFHGTHVAFWNKYFPKLLKRRQCENNPGLLGSRSTGSSHYTSLYIIIPFVSGIPLNLLF